MKQLAGKTIYSVSEVNGLARASLENLSFWVEGEISSFKGLNERYRFLYFDLKDANSGFKLPCILEPGIFRDIDFDLIEGQKILVLGNLTLWEKDAKYQMYIFKIEKAGEGVLAVQFEKLKKKLEDKGYFDIEQKKDMPTYPKNIAVITSKVSAAWQDFRSHSVDLVSGLDITIFDVLVQGQSAAKLICDAITKADKLNFDLVVLIRGGGSAEDLAAYNEEIVADAIFCAKTCILVGVGHESDVSIAQLVADVSASTPTDAAKKVVANWLALNDKLANIQRRLKSVFINYLFSYEQRISSASHKLAIVNGRYSDLPRHLAFLVKTLFGSGYKHLEAYDRKLVSSHELIYNNYQAIMMKYDGKMDSYSEKLLLLSPANILKRGYNIVFGSGDKIVRDIDMIAIGDTLRIKFAKGEANSRVISKKQND